MHDNTLCYHGHFLKDETVFFDITKYDGEKHQWLCINKIYFFSSNTTLYVESTWFQQQLIAFCSGLPFSSVKGIGCSSIGSRFQKLTSEISGKDICISSEDTNWGVYIDIECSKQILECLYAKN